MSATTTSTTTLMGVSEREPMNIQGQPYKLRSGEWGAITEHPAKVGDKILIVSRSGFRCYSAVRAVVETHDDHTLVTLCTKVLTRNAWPASGYSNCCTGRAGCRCYDCE